MMLNMYQARETAEESGEEHTPARGSGDEGQSYNLGMLWGFIASVKSSCTSTLEHWMGVSEPSYNAAERAARDSADDYNTKPRYR